MRKKLPIDEKRSSIIGVKVKPETRAQLEYIAAREAEKLSTHIDRILKAHIQQYFSTYRIKWDELTPEERGEK